MFLHYTVLKGVPLLNKVVFTKKTPNATFFVRLRHYVQAMCPTLFCKTFA